MGALHSHVRDRRQRAGLAQRDLAERVGISRQSLSAVESGAAVPSTAVALQLAHALGCQVEDLFGLAADEGVLAAHTAPPLSPVAAGWARGSRVRLGRVRDRWVAHALGGADPACATTPADGVVVRAPARSGALRVRPLRPASALGENLLVAGCDPALGLLAGHLLEGPPGPRLHWLAASSGAALDAFAQGLVHLAGLHLFDATSGEHNLPALRARLAQRPVVVVHLASWMAGVVLPAGRRAVDLAAPRVRLCAREPGSAARALLDATLAAAGAPLARARVAETVYSHHAVAESVAAGRADAGIATEAAAAAYGLDFMPLTADRFELVLDAESVAQANVQRLLETLASGRFRRDLGALPGYTTSLTGQIVARLSS
jgi:molybdate-binding protein/DNA-binding XRE family transcriptional regulator